MQFGDNHKRLSAADQKLTEVCSEFYIGSFLRHAGVIFSSFGFKKYSYPAGKAQQGERKYAAKKRSAPNDYAADRSRVSGIMILFWMRKALTDEIDTRELCEKRV